MNIQSPSIQTLLCGQDNYIYLLIGGSKQSLVIDPGAAETVLSAIDKHKLKLTHVLLTHHHADHTAGAAALKRVSGCRVVGPDVQRITGVDETLHENQILSLGEFSIHMISTPGHTRTSVCYVLKIAETTAAVFTGDTLFIGGCGRCFETLPQQMHQSLMKLAALPDEMLVYPGHNYTLENYQFALTVESDNAIVGEQLKRLKEKGSLSAIPSTVGLEKQTNPFLRTHSLSIRKHLNMDNAENWEIFARLRKMKDVF